MRLEPTLIKNDRQVSLVEITGPDSLRLRARSCLLPLKLRALWFRGGVPRLSIDQASMRREMLASAGLWGQYRVLDLTSRSRGEDAPPRDWQISRQQYLDCRLRGYMGAIIMLLAPVSLYGCPFRLRVGPDGAFDWSWAAAPPQWQDGSRELTENLVDLLLAYVQCLGVAMRPGGSGTVTVGRGRPEIVIDFGYRIDGWTWARGWRSGDDGNEVRPPHNPPTMNPSWGQG